MNTAILGAGVSGLALARLLVEGGLSRANVTLFEAAPAPGGLCASKSVDGFSYDTAGGHILFSKRPEVTRWMIERAGGDEAFVRRERHTRIRFRDRFVHYPFENGLGDLPPEVNFECLSGYVQAWHSRRVNGSAAPEDFARWIRWRFGDGIAEHFMDPYNEKIWKRPLSEIATSWVLGRVPDAPIEDVLRAAIGIRTEGYVHQAIFWYPRRGGFQTITDGLAAEISDRILLSTPATDVRRVGSSWKVNGLEFDRVVSTLPLNVLPDVVAGMPRSVASAMRGLAYNAIDCYLLALSRPAHPDLSWVYLPHHDQGPTNRVTYMSNYSPGNAPPGRTSFLCEVTRPGGQPSPGPGLVEDVVAGMAHAGLVARDEILFTDHTPHEFAYIVYDHGFEAKRRAALGWCDEVGLLPLGRFGRYEYHNSDQCVMQAMDLAERMLVQAVKG